MTTKQVTQTRYMLGIFTGKFDYTLDYEGYNSRFDGAFFANGDKCNGLLVWENQEMFYTAIDAEGNEYTTPEMPYEIIDLTTSGLFLQNGAICFKPFSNI